MSSTGELLQKLQEGGGDGGASGAVCSGWKRRLPGKGTGSGRSGWSEPLRRSSERGPRRSVQRTGRTEIGGNHTDHQHGRVLCGSVGSGYAGLRRPQRDGPGPDPSEGYPALEVDLRDLKVREEEKNSSPALVRGVAARLVELGCRPAGFDAYVTSTVLSGSGLSSSAAYEILVATIVDCFFGGGTLDPVERAKVGQYAENVYFGKPCGLMDQMGSSVGGAVAIDFADPAAPW